MVWLLVRVLKDIQADRRYENGLIEIIGVKMGNRIQLVISAKDFGLFIKEILEKDFQVDNNNKLCRNAEVTFESAEETIKIPVIRSNSV